MGKNRFQRVFLPSHSLDTVSSSDMLFCFELLSKEMAKEKVVLLRVQQVKTPTLPDRLLSSARVVSIVGGVCSLRLRPGRSCRFPTSPSPSAPDA